MPLHLERIEWMPSPPLAPDDGPIDNAHLDRMTLGDLALEREVLAMFSAQAVGLIARLATLCSEGRSSEGRSSEGRSSEGRSSEGRSSEGLALAHTLKGSARAIGAFRVGDAAEALEAALRNGDDPSEAIAGLKDSVAEARSAIDARLRRS
jgi:HPt (histidine-containing phosphotransfer) domain-containing protein